MRPFAGRSLGRTHSEEALSHRIENKKFAVFVGDDDSIAHVGQNGLEDLVGAREFFRGAFSFHDQIQLRSDRYNHLDQLFVLASRFTHEKLDHGDDSFTR